MSNLVLGLFLAAAAGVLSQITFIGSSWFQMARRAGAAAMMMALLLMTGAELDVLQRKQESGGQPRTDVVASGDWSSYLVSERTMQLLGKVTCRCLLDKGDCLLNSDQQSRSPSSHL